MTGMRGPFACLNSARLGALNFETSQNASRMLQVNTSHKFTNLDMSQVSCQALVGPRRIHRYSQNVSYC